MATMSFKRKLCRDNFFFSTQNMLLSEAWCFIWILRFDMHGDIICICDLSYFELPSVINWNIVYDNWVIARVTIMQWFVYDNIYGRFIIKIIKCGISIKLEDLMTCPYIIIIQNNYIILMTNLYIIYSCIWLNYVGCTILLIEFISILIASNQTV